MNVFKISYCVSFISLLLWYHEFLSLWFLIFFNAAVAAGFWYLLGHAELLYHPRVLAARKWVTSQQEKLENLGKHLEDYDEFLYSGLLFVFLVLVYVNSVPFQRLLASDDLLTSPNEETWYCECRPLSIVVTQQTVGDRLKPIKPFAPTSCIVVRMTTGDVVWETFKSEEDLHERRAATPPAWQVTGRLSSAFRSWGERWPKVIIFSRVVNVPMINEELSKISNWQASTNLTSDDGPAAPALITSAWNYATDQILKVRTWNPAIITGTS